MGVQGLWELLAPVGRRVSVETLAGKKLAIDASIWMVQFMKAMRDDKGEMVHNAHLLGFFRRICKLLFLRAKPVFVFDGATPALKRRTVAARRRHRDNARGKIRKTAEKLLLNHLKEKRLEELAAEIKKQREGSKEKQIPDDDSKGKKVLDSGSEIGAKGSTVGPGGEKGFGVSAQESLLKEKPIIDDDLKGKKVLDSCSEIGAEGSSVVPCGDKGFQVSAQENLDELLAASLAAEEELEINKNVLASSDGGLAKEESDDDESEELILPIDNVHIDPAVLASLPPSMQLDLLVQMRERIMAENRQKYQKIKKAPTKFSELQIQSYLKTIAFRREIDEVQKCAAGRGISGVQTSRIASEANREFIFSSSFTGDKQALASRGVANSGNGDHHALAKPSTSDLAKCSLLSQPKLVKEVSISECIKDFGPDVETYHDENGRVRVSRVRGLGIRMTRDLQRNLDLMEEYEQEKRRGDNYSDPEASRTKNDDVSGISGNTHPPSAFVSNKGKDETISTKNRELPLDGRDHLNELIVHGNEDAIAISFSEDDSGMEDMDDDNIFMQLVSEGQTSNLPMEGVHSDKSTNDSESDCIWGEGLVKDFTESPKGLAKEIAGNAKSDYKENRSSLAESSYEEADVDWEEGVCHDPGATSHCQDEPEKDVSRGLVEEEADIQEAIRRSLEDYKEQKSSTLFIGDTDLERSIKDQSSDGVVLHKLITNTCVHLDNDSKRSPSHTDRQLDNSSKKDDLQITDSSEMSLASSNISGLHLDGDSSLINRRKDEHNVSISQTGNIPLGKPSDGHPSLLEQSLGASNEVPSKSCSRMPMEENFDIRPNTNFKTTNDGSKAVIGDSNRDSCHVPRSNLSFERGYSNLFSDNNSLMEEMIVNTGTEQQQATEETNTISNLIGDQNTQNSFNYQMEVSEASLDKEISLLRQERANLGNEQRLLERNADSVSNEMFAECQELLQMFGLPYIIAPMEAEAQCAYMEMTNLVDGVVTDDSDVFLFGAQSVFKNIFDDRKYVETYFMKDIECELGLNREKLICMALLLGSDYTEGVSGIGIVNAIEVVHAFPEEDGLQKFREWIESPDPAILGKLDNGSNSKRRSLKENNNGADEMRKSAEGDASEETVSRGHDDEKPTGSGSIKDIFMNKHRNVSKNWHIPPSFPSDSVINAYTSPQVDESTEPFTWGKPDLPLLRKLCWEKFGWTNQKADELLVPVLKEYNKHETQLRLEAFYTFNERFAKIRSQRIKKALKGITGTLSSDLTDDLIKEGPSSRKKRSIGLSVTEEYEPENSPGGNSKRGKKVLKQSRGRKTEKEIMHSEDVAVILEQGEIGDSSVLSVNKTGRGSRGRGRGRGGRRRGRGRGRGRGIRSSPIKADSESTDASDSDDSDGNVQMKNDSKVPQEKLRRSMRPLKQVQYAEEDFGVDESSGTLNKSDSELQEVAMEQEPTENDSRCRIEDSTDVDKGTYPFSKDCPSGEYLSSGGGFCVDENDQQGDTVQLAAHPIQDSAGTHYEGRYGDATGSDGCKQHFLEDGSSRDYLFSEGGFCMDESDEQVDATQPAANQIMDPEPLRVTSDVSEGPQNFGLDNSVSDDMKRISEPLQDSSLLVENISSHQAGQTNHGLSAMSSLRRKRRKT